MSYWQKDSEGREMISAYELKKRRKHLAHVEADLRRIRSLVLKSLRDRSWSISRSTTIWGYLLARKHVTQARAAITGAVVQKAPNWSHAVRASRGWATLEG
jgi:hypothetical protein